MLDRLRSEWIYARTFIGMLPKVTALAKNPTRTINDMLPELAARHGERPAILGHDQSFTYRALYRRAMQYARWARQNGVGPGDSVALFMRNRPEYLAAWLGIVASGGSALLVNTNLSGYLLASSLELVPARHIVVDVALMDQLESARDDLAEMPTIWTYGNRRFEGVPDIDATLAEISADPLSAEERVARTITDPALYILTSGTTGLPKAAIINHYRVMAAMTGYSGICQARADDRIYVAQPMYHTTGGVLAPGIALMAGGSVAVREKFSASEFWDDIVAFDCTMFQYIGELCRYLLNAPTTAAESRHQIRVCNGNGLRPDVWMDFKTRFRIPRIIEWFAATEGNVLLFNLDGKPGSVGRIPTWLRHKFPVKVAQFDVETEQPARNGDGWLTECQADEVGEAIGEITNDPNKPGQRFDGYADKGATERKIVRDAFKSGDAWFRTGDLMRRDKDGYFYFIDRVGDTFRWKGENVSTTQVQETLTVFPGVREATVYGVTVPRHDGRAGMAALVADEGLDLEGLRHHVHRQLPAYARPLFLRLRTELDMTGTFKIRKIDLASQGFDLDAVSDPVFIDDPETGAFTPLTQALAERLGNGSLRL